MRDRSLILMELKLKEGWAKEEMGEEEKKGGGVRSVVSGERDPPPLRPEGGGKRLAWVGNDPADEVLLMDSPPEAVRGASPGNSSKGGEEDP